MLPVILLAFVGGLSSAYAASEKLVVRLERETVEGKLETTRITILPSSKDAVMVQANSGLPWGRSGKRSYKGTHKAEGSCVAELVKLARAEAPEVQRWGVARGAKTPGYKTASPHLTRLWLGNTELDRSHSFVKLLYDSVRRLSRCARWATVASGGPVTPLEKPPDKR